MANQALISDERGADAALWVEIYKHPVENAYKSKEAGHPVFDEVDFITIRVPGDQLNVVMRPLNDEDKARFPRHWAHYQNISSNDNVEGWLVDEWPIISRAVAFQLRALGFKTVEHVANASDQNIVKLGMMAGMEPHVFREKARAFLALARNTAAEQKAVQENAELRQQLAAMQATIERLAAGQAALAATTTEGPAGKRPYRKRTPAPAQAAA